MIKEKKILTDKFDNDVECIFEDRRYHYSLNVSIDTSIYLFDNKFVIKIHRTVHLSRRERENKLSSISFDKSKLSKKRSMRNSRKVPRL